MHAFSAFFLCFFTLAASTPVELKERAVGLGVNADLRFDVNINKLIDQIAELAKPDLNEAKPWSYQQMTSMIKPKGNSVYVDCVKSGSANKGCPAEYPWNLEGCFMWLTDGGVSWRRCDKRKTGDAYWDAGSSLRHIYESKQINSKPSRWDKLMKSPKRFEIINKVRY